eukprot:391462_1
MINTSQDKYISQSEHNHDLPDGYNNHSAFISCKTQGCCAKVMKLNGRMRERTFFTELRNDIDKLDPQLSILRSQWKEKMNQQFENWIQKNKHKPQATKYFAMWKDSFYNNPSNIKGREWIVNAPSWDGLTLQKGSYAWDKEATENWVQLSKQIPQIKEYINRIGIILEANIYPKSVVIGAQVVQRYQTVETTKLKTGNCHFDDCFSGMLVVINEYGEYYVPGTCSANKRRMFEGNGYGFLGA